MIFEIDLHPIALDELQESYNWYNARTPGSGDRFMSAVNNKLYQITKHPYAYSKKKRNLRSVNVDGYPYTIIFEVIRRQKMVFVTHIFHTKRDPKLKFK